MTVVALLSDQTPGICRQKVQFASLLDHLQQAYSAVGAGEERFLAIFLDHERAYLDDCLMACGHSAHLAVRLRDIFARALAIGASAIIVSHNHPSGDCRPSMSDIDATRRLREIACALDIELLDHLIFTREKVYSMRAGGKL